MTPDDLKFRKQWEDADVVRYFELASDPDRKDSLLDFCYNRLPGWGAGLNYAENAFAHARIRFHLRPILIKRLHNLLTTYSPN